MSTRRTGGRKFVQICQKGASGQIFEIEGLVFFIFIYFPPDSPTEVTRE